MNCTKSILTIRIGKVLKLGLLRLTNQVEVLRYWLKKASAN